MFKRSSIYGIAALIAAACIFSACPTGNSDPEEPQNPDTNAPDTNPPNTNPDTNPPAPDTTAPQLTAIEANGFWVVLTYNEALDEASAPDAGDFTLSNLSGTIDTVDVTGSKVTLTLDASADSTDGSITLDYTPGTNPIKDAAGNAAVALTTESVTNNTLAAPVDDGTGTDPGAIKTESADGSGGYTLLTFTYADIGSYTLQYAIIANSASPDADTVWSDAPDTTVQTDDNLVVAATSDDDQIFVRFKDELTGYVSAPADTGVTASAG